MPQVSKQFKKKDGIVVRIFIEGRRRGLLVFGLMTR